MQKFNLLSEHKKATRIIESLKCWHRSIFPGSHPPSIFDTGELNFCVRNGNRWILTAISTNYLIKKTNAKNRRFLGKLAFHASFMFPQN